MQINRSGSQPSGKGPAQFFTGSVRLDPLIQTTPPARTGGASVTFEPGEKHYGGDVENGNDAHRRARERGGKNVDWMEHVTDEEYAAGENAE